MQNLNRIRLYLIAFLFCTGCTSAQENKHQEANVVRFIYTDWDRSYSTLIGSDSVMMQKCFVTSKDSSITGKIKISKKTVNYIADLVRQNCGDSAKIKTITSEFAATEVFVITNNDTLDFWIQTKGKTPNFFEKIIKGISSSRYNQECDEVIKELTIYDRMTKHLQ